jgi:hypothetical protein
MNGIALEAETLAGHFPRLAPAEVPWINKTDTEEPACFSGRTAPRLHLFGACSQWEGTSADRDAPQGWNDAKVQNQVIAYNAPPDWSKNSPGVPWAKH